MKFNILFILVLSILVFSCEKDDDLPILQAASIDYAALTSNEFDKNRLCMGEVLSKLILEEKFREFLKLNLVNESNEWNNEILLIKYWNKKLYDDLTFAELLGQVLDKYDLCVKTIEEFETMFFNDPVLALKIPDIIDAEKWDTENTIPFLYIKTNRFVKNGLNTDTASMVGIHGSGVIDRYYWGTPKYYPIVLKKSEDNLMVDRHLFLSNGINFNDYHDYNPNLLSLENLLIDPVFVQGEEKFVVRINDLLKTINEQNNKLQTPYVLDNCSEQCVFDCIPESERKLTTKNVFIDISNPNSLRYFYSGYFRLNSHLILEDNLIFMVATNHLDDVADNTPDWKRNIIGSFRINDLFDVQYTNAVHYTKLKVEGKTFEFPEIDITFDVLGNRSIPVDNMVLASGIYPDDILVYSSHRIKLDMLLNEYIAIDGNSFLTTDFVRDNVSNYDLFCFHQKRTLGSNSLAIECDF